MNRLSPRTQKQIRIAAITGGILCVIASGFLLVRRVADESAHVVIRYANEEGNSHEQQGIAPLSIQNQYRFNVSGGHQFVAVLHNPNDGWHASRISYRFTIADALGEREEELEGESFVPAGGERLVIETFSDDEFVPEHFSVVIESVDWVDAAGREIPDIRVRHAVFESTPGSATVTGSAVNDSLVGVADVETGVLAINGAGEPVGAGVALINSLDAGEEETIRVHWEGELEGVATLSFLPVAQSVRKSE